MTSLALKNHSQLSGDHGISMKLRQLRCEKDFKGTEYLCAVKSSLNQSGCLYMQADSYLQCYIIYSWCPLKVDTYKELTFNLILDLLNNGECVHT